MSDRSNDASASQPLLQAKTPEQQKAIAHDPNPSVFSAGNTHASDNAAVEPSPHDGKFKRNYTISRQKLQNFLSSRTQHWCVLTLVTLDLLGIFADIFINLYTCEEGTPSPKWEKVRNALGIMGLVFSCLFMLELIMSVWAFGWRYFASYFHTFDATVIFAGFIVDVLLHGVLEEVASLVIVLRLWRFFKIVEEFSVGAQEQMDGLELRIEALELENQELKTKLTASKSQDGYDEEAQVGGHRST